MRRFTDRQALAWPAAIARAQRYVTSSTITEDLDGYHWSANWRDELRPGRGQYVDAVWQDGEYLVQIAMDVYGAPTVSVAETNWLHSDANEECDCEFCLAEQADG